VDVNTIPGSGPFYAGSALSLRCIVEVGVTLDIPYFVTVEWLKSGLTLGSDGRRTISNTTEVSAYVHESTLVLNPLSSQLDTGSYACQVAVGPILSSVFVRGVGLASMEAVIVQSESLVICICIR